MPSDTLKNENFRPHPALKSLLEWISKHGGAQPIRNAASRALTIYNSWARQQSRDCSAAVIVPGGWGMKQLLDTVWQRRGVSWIWDDEVPSSVAEPSEVFSLRELIRASQSWPDDLPSNKGSALVVAGLDACLDLLTPVDAEGWLGNELKSCHPVFPGCYSGEAALVFWLPKGDRTVPD